MQFFPSSSTILQAIKAFSPQKGARFRGKWGLATSSPPPPPEAPRPAPPFLLGAGFLLKIPWGGVLPGGVGGARVRGVYGEFGGGGAEAPFTAKTSPFFGENALIGGCNFYPHLPQFHSGKKKDWQVPNPPGANPLVAERAPWRSSQSLCGRGSAAYWKSLQIPVSFLLHTWQPLCDPIVTRGEGSFSYQGVSTRGVRHSPERLSFWVRRPPGGVGVFHAKGWWPKTSCTPSKLCLPWVSKRGIRDVPGILPGCPGPLAVLKKFVQKNFTRIFRSAISQAIRGCDFAGGLRFQGARVFEDSCL